jgi:hypothetical protein
VEPAPLGDYRYAKVMKSGRVRKVKVAVYSLEVLHEHDEWPEMAVREKLWIAAKEGAELVDEPELRVLIAQFAR